MSTSRIVRLTVEEAANCFVGIIVVLAVQAVMNTILLSKNNALTIEQLIIRSVVNPELMKPMFLGSGTLSIMKKEGGDQDRTKIPNWHYVEPKPGSELYMLAEAIYFESRSESFTGKLKVAGVILERVKSPRWPRTISAVVKQGEKRLNQCQFSYRCDKKPDRVTNKKSKAWIESVIVAQVAFEAFELKVSLGCAHSYHADYVKSKKALAWFKTLRKDIQVGRHIFYCDK